MNYRCKHIKPNGDVVDGCGWIGTHVVKCPQCGSLVLRALVRGSAIIFWDGIGYYFVETPHEGKQPIGPYDDIDDAITAAKVAGFKIAGVQQTRGMLPAQGAAAE